MMVGGSHHPAMNPHPMHRPSSANGHPQMSHTTSPPAHPQQTLTPQPQAHYMQTHPHQAMQQQQQQQQRSMQHMQQSQRVAQQSLVLPQNEIAPLQQLDNEDLSDLEYILAHEAPQC